MNIPAATTEEGARTTHSDWIGLALETLVSDGVEKIKVSTLANGLCVSRSSFYWFFKNRDDLLDQLLSHWEETNTSGIVDRAVRPADTITEAILNVFECWLDKRVYDPHLDFAIRDWARRDSSVRKRLERAEAIRIDALTEMYAYHGYSPRNAEIQAKTLYFMQVGYYALEVDETIEERLEYVNDYVRAFSGSTATKEELERFSSYARNLPPPTNAGLRTV